MSKSIFGFNLNVVEKYIVGEEKKNYLLMTGTKCTRISGTFNKLNSSILFFKKDLVWNIYKIML